MRKREGAETLVIHCAQVWWESHRPEGWSMEQHLENPTVNLRRSPDELLAQAVVRLVGDANRRPPRRKS